MNRIEKITIILANLVTVIQKRGDYNLDEYSNKIAALYSSQEPQKSEKQKVADLLGVPLSEVHTLDIQDGKLVEIVDVPQSVSVQPQQESASGLLLIRELIANQLKLHEIQIVKVKPHDDEESKRRRKVRYETTDLILSKIKNMEMQLLPLQKLHVADVKPSPSAVLNKD